MIKFFRQSYIIQYVVIALMVVAFWVPSFIAGMVQTDLGSSVTPLYGLIERILDFSPYAKLAFAFLLMLLEAALFNMILVDNQIVGKVGTMGAFVFVILMNLTRTQVNFFPFAIATLFILLMLRVVFRLYLSPKPELDLLKAGIYIALASMCYFPSILLIVWMLLAVSIVKIGSLRLQLIPIMGFLFFYFLYFTCVFLFGDFLTTIHGYRDWFMTLSLTVSGFNLKTILTIAFLIVCAVLLFFGGGSSSFEKTVAVRTKMTISVLLAVFGILLLFVGGNVLFNGLIFIGLSIIVAYEFSYLSNTAWVNLFLTLFLLLVFANHYYFKLL